MPMLIMRSVPQSETGASNGLNARFRSLGTSAAAAAVGAVLATYVADVDGVPVPTGTAFQLSFVLGGAAAVAALVIALFIPRGRDPHEQHPSLPE
jgi:sugar phosphate permease